MANSYDGLARMLVLNVGGKANITSVSHCDTRLRFVLKDEGQANTDLIKSLDGVVSVIKEDGQYQIVIGSHVPEVYDRVLTVGRMQELGTSVSQASKSSAGSVSAVKMCAAALVTFVLVELIVGVALARPQNVAIPVAIVCGIVCAVIYKVLSSGNIKQDAQASATKSETVKILPEKIYSPVKGQIIPLDQLGDDAFASGVLGEGVGFLPEEGRVYSPCDGKITTFFPTGHAIGIRSDNGADILLHIGIDTVKLDGKGFNPKKHQGDRTQKGELLLEFDPEIIKAAGMSYQTPMIITNTAVYSRITVAREGMADHGDTVIETVPK